MDERKGDYLSRSGSQSRKQTIKRTANCTPEEAALFDAIQLHYPSCSDMIKDRVLQSAKPLPRAPRTSPRDKQFFGQQLGELGALHDLITDLKRNAGTEHHPAFDQLTGVVRAMRNDIMTRLGRQP